MLRSKYDCQKAEFYHLKLDAGIAIGIELRYSGNGKRDAAKSDPRNIQNKRSFRSFRTTYVQISAVKPRKAKDQRRGRRDGGEKSFKNRKSSVASALRFLGCGYAASRIS
jgi:hypothetical protein